LIDAVTVVFAPAASVPPVADKVTHDCAFDAVQSIGEPPVFVIVYDRLDGVNGPPAVPDEVNPPAGVTVIGPDTDPAVTVTVIASESLSGGVPLSATTTVTVKVPEEAGVQLKTPVEPLIVAPAGAPAPREKARV
jgi:hypothetical protein